MIQKEPERRAHFYQKEKEVHYWKSPNLYGVEKVKNLVEAIALVKGTAVPQRILRYKTVYDTPDGL